MPNSTRSVVEEYFRLLGSGDLEGATELLSEPIDWFTPGDTDLIPWMGSRSSHEQVREFFRQAGENMEPEKFQVHRIVVEGELAIALGHFQYKVKATGKSFASDFALELRVTDGLIDRYRMHEDSHAISLAFLT
ncbi:nuclear transport factor 2 family protein [Streptomyces sp.]|uniref:nuclear transport factor 2 family protein n=1 Tax=Streptomyces sp. TaxID=1931 RepID=UPI002D76DD68|nr:nuclear transport factor 2 family protein [Streptomyces sp.]HET6353420.1 nuclear transport factor 2 family protein [Streptomyces sp.]